MKHPLSTAVALAIFRRPERTEQLLRVLREARPTKLYVFADGPRPDRPDDAALCAATRALIDKLVDWPCQVHRNFSATNLGCRRRMASGISWVFENEADAIILEDDCLPDPTFFSFCQELLDRYRHNTQVMMIGGANFQDGQIRGDCSYYFSRFTHIWGWATWRRAWILYDLEMASWPTARNSNYLGSIFDSPMEVNYWTKTFDHIHQGKVDTWDHQWGWTCMLHGGFSVVPQQNLISNLGFTADATHTTDPLDRNSGRPLRAIEFPLKHPGSIERNVEADLYEYLSLFRVDARKSVLERLRNSALKRYRRFKAHLRPHA